MSFKIFFAESEEKDDVKNMIKKLPKGHQDLLKGYKFKYQSGNTLKGDNGHVGLIHQDKITVAAPWVYSREFTSLHEIAHLVFQELMDKKLRKEWEKLFLQEKKNMPKNDALNQNAEEIFCMVYAATYTKHPPTTYTNKKWQDFIKRLPT